MTVSFVKGSRGYDLAFQRREATSTGPAVLFLCGFGSDMNGTKAKFLDEVCGRFGLEYVRFDYSGHGFSKGFFQDGTIGGWLQDSLDIVDNIVSSPFLIIGSSMGGWIGLHVALQRFKRVVGYIGLAAAPDFTKDIQFGMSEAQRAELDTKEFFYLPHDYEGEPHMITSTLLIEGKKHCILDNSIQIDCPVRLIQGGMDKEVSVEKAKRLLNAITGKNKKLFIQHNSDHSLSSVEDLGLLEKTLKELVQT